MAVSPRACAPCLFHHIAIDSGSKSQLSPPCLYVLSFIFGRGIPGPLSELALSSAWQLAHKN